MRNPDVPCYIISHQLSLPLSPKPLQFIANKINTQLLNSFDKCIIPDDESSQLSGKLSSNSKVRNQVKVGPLSRMKKYDMPNLYDVAIILSGPEPARTKLETSLTQKLISSNYKVIIVRGTSQVRIGIPHRLDVIDLADSNTINDILMSTRIVISRSGYSSIMDYAVTKTPTILIPTPGQPEQEYLAQQNSNQKKYALLGEKELNSSDFDLDDYLNKFLDLI